MGAHKARERREERLTNEAKERAEGVAILASLLGIRHTESGIFQSEARHLVGEARHIIAAAYEAEGLPSPFPAHTSGGAISMTHDEIRRVIADDLGLPIEEVRDDVTADQLGVDSLDFIELTMELEHATGHYPGDDAWLACRTVGDLIRTATRADDSTGGGNG